MIRRPSSEKPAGHTVSVLIAAALLVACTRDAEPKRGNTDTQTTGPSAPSATTANVARKPAFSESPPSAFDEGKSVTLVNNQVTACTGVALDGWVQLTCEARSGTGGTLLGGEIREGGTSEVTKLVPAADGKLRFVLPWQPGKRGLARIEWSDGAFDVATSNLAGGFTRVVGAAQGAACSTLERAQDDKIKRLRAGETKSLSPRDLQRFPKFGKCEIHGADAWALELEDVRADGDGVDREVIVKANVVHIDEAGRVTKATWGPLPFAPGKVVIPELMTFDYDGDGSAEVVVRHDVLARGAKSVSKPLPKMPAVFTYKTKRVSPYAGAGLLSSGGVFAENLDGDERPDIGDYGPFIGWLEIGCGRGQCPDRVVGPRFYQVSLVDSMFDSAASAVTATLRRACAGARTPLVGEVESVAHKARLAQNVACARLTGVSTEAIFEQLAPEKSRICGDFPNCQLYSLLETWAKAEPPIKLVLPGKE